MSEIFERKGQRLWLLPIVMVVLVVIVAVAGAFGIFYYLRNQAVQADNNKFETTNKLANSENSRNNFRGAAQAWIDYGDSTPNKAHKNTAYIKAAGELVAGRDYADAVKECKQAEAVSGVTFEEAEVAATSYTALGDKPNAIKYYQDAIKLFPQDIVDRGATIAQFQREVQYLQGSQ